MTANILKPMQAAAAAASQDGRSFIQDAWTRARPARQQTAASPQRGQEDLDALAALLLPDLYAAKAGKSMITAISQSPTGT